MAWPQVEAWLVTWVLVWLKVSGRADSFGIDTIDEGITIDSDDKSKEYFDFFPFGGDGSETDGGTDTESTSYSHAIPNVQNTWSNDESTLLDNVSLGSIKFKEIGNSIYVQPTSDSVEMIGGMGLMKENQLSRSGKKKQMLHQISFYEL